MNQQIRRLFIVILAMFALLGVTATHNQVFQAPSLNADARNERTILHAAETDRGPIIVADTAIASSTKIEGSKRFQRTYSPGPLYAPITGFFSSAFSQATGLEAASEQILDGQSQALLVQRIRNLFTGAQRQGGGVVLTVNPELQQIAAEQLGRRKGAVVALDAKTGAVLALYSSPTYDPNTLAAFDSAAVNATYQALLDDPTAPLSNRAIAGSLYAPGSTFKLLTTIALLENGIASPTTHMDSPVSAPLPGSSTSVPNALSAECGDGHPTLTEAFARSCNTTFILASQNLTESQLSDVTQRFGFGKPLSIPLNVTPSSFPKEMDAAQFAMASIGQFDVKVTPLQMAMVAQAIANGGTMMQPYLIAQIVDADLTVQSQTRPSVSGTPINAEIAAQLTEMMTSAVNEPYGTGQHIRLNGIQVAAKTGTAETGVGEFTNGWAVGFAPAEDPQIVFAVIVEGDDADPHPFGSTVAGPIARALLEAGIR